MRFCSLLRPDGLAHGLSSAALGRRCVSSSAVKGASSIIFHSHGLREQLVQRQDAKSRRTLVTLAIETSCDDTCVAVLEKHPSGGATLHFNGKVTSDSRQFGGVHPAVAVAGHTQHLAPLVQAAIAHLPSPSQSRTSSP